MSLALLLLGCTTTVRFPPDLWAFETIDTGGPDTGLFDTAPPPVLPTGDVGTVSDASLRCDPGNTVWIAEVETVGWTDSVVLYIGLDAAVPEAHGLLLADSDPAGAWDRYIGGPWTAGVDPADFDPATNSTWACGAAGLAWAFVVVDRFGQISDCAMGGAVTTPFGDAVIAVDPRLSEGDCRPL